MKKITIIFCWIAFVHSASAQVNPAPEILKVLQQQEKSWNQGNLEQFMNGYWKNDSLLFLGQKGPSYGWQKALDNYKKAYPDKVTMGTLQFDILELKMLSNEYAFVLGKWHLTRKPGNIGGYFTLLFKKIDNQWFIIADHTS